MFTSRLPLAVILSNRLCDKAIAHVTVGVLQENVDMRGAISDEHCAVISDILLGWS